MANTLLERLENLPLDDHLRYETQKSPVVQNEKEGENLLLTVTQKEAVQPLLATNHGHFQIWDDLNRIKKSLQARIYAVIRQETGCGKKECAGWYRKIYKTDKVEDNPILARIYLRTCVMEKDRARYEELEKKPAKLMIKCVEQMPIWKYWAKDVKGCGAKTMSKLLAVWGNPSDFPTVAKSWKRLGLGLVKINGKWERTRKSRDKKLAKIYGYSPRRRSIVWEIEDSLFKSGGDGKYRTMFLARREYEKEMHPEIDHEKPGKKGVPGRGFSYQRARRYMVKKFIRDMWCMWKKLDGNYTPDPNGHTVIDFPEQS